MKNMSTALVLFAIMSFTLTGCDGLFGGSQKSTGASTKKEMEQTEINHQRLVKVTPPPKIMKSQERINLSKRLERFNTDAKVSYIYLISFGKVMGFYTVKGKVSSVNSLLTTPQQILEISVGGGSGPNPAIAIPSPDLDGSYGSNGDAIFFFTTDDTYVEWNDKYMLVDKPLKMSTPPALVIQTTEK